MPNQPFGNPEFYDAFPSSDHQPGDIWSSLPTHGVLNVAHAPALVVTPACDLANRKVETITYLPIVPVADYLCSRALLSEVLKITDGQLNASKAGIELKGIDTPLPPSAADVDAAVRLLEEYVSRSKLGDKESRAAQRAKDGLDILLTIVKSASRHTALPALTRAMGERETQSVLRRIVTNGFRSDVHFLPSDRQPKDWTALPLHAVALFRYPMTIPIDLLDVAIATSNEAWSSEMSRWLEMYPCASTLTVKRPMKPLRVRTQYIADLLTRYTSLYGRLGSPDFSEVMIERFVSEIGATQ